MDTPKEVPLTWYNPATGEHTVIGTGKLSEDGIFTGLITNPFFAEKISDGFRFKFTSAGLGPSMQDDPFKFSDKKFRDEGRRIRDLIRPEGPLEKIDQNFTVKFDPGKFDIPEADPDTLSPLTEFTGSVARDLSGYRFTDDPAQCVFDDDNFRYGIFQNVEKIPDYLTESGMFDYAYRDYRTEVRDKYVELANVQNKINAITPPSFISTEDLLDIIGKVAPLFDAVPPPPDDPEEFHRAFARVAVLRQELKDKVGETGYASALDLKQLGDRVLAEFPWMTPQIIVKQQLREQQDQQGEAVPPVPEDTEQVILTPFDNPNGPEIVFRHNPQDD